MSASTNWRGSTCPADLSGAWITLSWCYHYKTGLAKQLFPSLRLNHPLPKGVCVRVGVSRHVCTGICVCTCILSTSLSSLAQCCSFQVSRITIWMLFLSLTTATISLWRHFINTTFCQSEWKDSLTHFFADGGLTLWSKRLNWKHENQKWENSGITSRWKKRKAATYRQLFHQCWNGKFLNHVSPWPHLLRNLVFPPKEKEHMLLQNICGNNGFTLLKHAAVTTRLRLTAAVELRQIPPCGWLPRLMSLQWLGLNGRLGALGCVRSKKRTNNIKDHHQDKAHFLSPKYWIKCEK